MLIAIDNSNHAMQAAKEGFALATQLKIPVTLIHIVDDYRVSILKRHFIVSEEEAFNRLKEEGEEFLEKVKEQGVATGLEVDTVLTNGSPAQKIVEIAKKIGADLIVMGTRGDSIEMGLGHRKFLGSISHSVIKKSPIPVYVVP
ncbi:MAG: universal stress protein [Promethearchaeota archaeon]